MVLGDELIVVSVNPLQFLEVDEPWAKLPDLKLTPERVIAFLCTPGIETELSSLADRYREISTEPKRLFAAPAEPRILEKLVWPLRHAKASYMVGNYLGTISLCGMVAEMVAGLIFDMGEIRMNDKLIKEEEQKRLFGSTFEKLSQNRRTEVLSAYGLIDVEMKAELDLIRTKRRRYLHLWSQDHELLPGDARETYHAAVGIVVRTLGQDVKDGKILLSPQLLKYLDRKGVYKPRGGDGD